MFGGEEEDEGIIPRVCRNLLTYQSSSFLSSAENVQFSFQVTYIEIFLEKVRDLLSSSSSSSSTSSSSSSSSNLRIREHPTEGPFVDGALCLDVHTLEECMKIIQNGNRNRMTASTKLNLQSSRSHAIFTIHCIQKRRLSSSPSSSTSVHHVSTDVEQQCQQQQQQQQQQAEAEAEEGQGAYSVKSKLNLIDLAGSENSLAAGTEGERLKEGAAINKSLLTLGRVIKILAENSNHGQSTSRERREGSSQGGGSAGGGGGGGRRRFSLLEKSVSERNLGTPSSLRGGGGGGGGEGGSSTLSSSPVPPSPSSSSSTLLSVKKNDKRSSLSPQPSSRVEGGGGSPLVTPPKSTTNGNVGGGSTMVPYRDSVLTYLLKESLGGNSKTTMIATIRPGE
jgi:hypothetical protein